MRYWIMGIITLVLLIIIFTMDIKNDYLSVFEDKMTIELESLDSDGYEWKYVIDNDIVKVDSDGKLSNQEGEMNDKSIDYWRWDAIKDGEAKITYTYSNDSKDLYTIYYEIKVLENKIYWISGEAKGLTDYPNPY